jgi:hypothetical protein
MKQSCNFLNGNLRVYRTNKLIVTDNKRDSILF